ncbi:MAG: AAA family ATPase, partial [Clostridia bacterium]
MRLKSLEMQGFKSFPDKTQLIFGDGITAIVGPNGSGKSNISDAVRWVLGEQSTKTLRGGKMEDVIFGGTVKRSAVGFAEVSLTIDNSDGVLPTDYNEVTITRRYYRSGESEFYINRSAVRLRDIHELLMDTGLGRDGYSIIGQGRIDEILSLKSEDRREIFEEAAGISKFRHRKDESERKLSATEENLVRIRDIISELAAQVEPLEIQAEQARRYLQIFEELKSLEIDMWMYNLDRNSENTARLKNDYAIADSQFERASALVSELYDEVEAISADMRIKDGELEAARTRHHEAERARDEVQHQISVLEATGANNEENIARIEAELCDEVGRAGGIDEQISERQARIDELTEREHVLEAEIAERAASIAGAAESSGDAAAVLESLRASMGARASESAQVQIEKSAADAELLGIDDRRAQIALRISERDASINDAKMRESELKHALAEAEDTCASVSNILAGCDIKRKKKTERVEAMEHKLSVLADLERDMEGFSFAVKTVLRAGERGALPGIHGTVAKLMSVPDKYTVAIETILGGALQNIVVSDEAAAKAAIAMLKSGNG